MNFGTLGAGFGGLGRGGAGAGFDYYVDSVNGNNSNTGISETQAVATWAGLEALGSLTGKRIAVAYGSVFREQVLIPDDSYIVPYGTPADGRPTVSGADILPNGSFSLTATRTYTYQISLPSIPSTSNSYASVSNANVLMVWENSVRLGATLTKKTSIADVESAAGSFWWDGTNKILYIHPADNGNPISNGKTYEASVRTLAIHGGDGFYVEGLIGEKAGAASSVGQQGYGILGYKSGTYKNCVGRWGWNHCGGVANGELADPLIFDTCEFYDHERQAEVTASTCFVAYKANATQCEVIMKDCYVHMPTYASGYGDIGIFAHGSACKFTQQGRNFAKNFRYGRQLIRDGGSNSLHLLDTGEQFVVDGCQYGDYINDTCNSVSPNVITKNCVVAATDYRRSLAVTARVIDCVNGIGAQGSGVVITVDGAKVLGSDSPASATDGIGVSMLGAGSSFLVTNSLFCQLGCVYQGTSGNPDASGCNNNEFRSCTRIYQGALYTPTFSTSLATWQSQSGEDANSTATSGTPDAADLLLPDWSGTVLGAG